MIETWGRAAAPEYMDDGILVELAEQVARHPWWQARSRLVARVLEGEGIPPGTHIADVGCGWGVTLCDLEARGYPVTGLDVSRQALDRLDAPGRRLVEVDLAGTFDVSRTFEVVLALDVIEHVDDDAAVVRNLARLVGPGGLVVVTVPALPGLTSDFDRVQGHRRRYTPATLRRAFRGSGLALQRLSWWGCWMVPVARMRRRARARGPAEAYAEYLRVPPRPVRDALELAFRLEEPLALRGLLPVGTSLVAVARPA